MRVVEYLRRAVGLPSRGSGSRDSLNNAILANYLDIGNYAPIHPKQERWGWILGRTSPGSKVQCKKASSGKPMWPAAEPTRPLFYDMASIFSSCTAEGFVMRVKEELSLSWT